MCSLFQKVSSMSYTYEKFQKMATLPTLTTLTCAVLKTGVCKAVPAPLLLGASQYPSIPCRRHDALS